jgi:hypothetical protein
MGEVFRAFRNGFTIQQFFFKILIDVGRDGRISRDVLEIEIKPPCHKDMLWTRGLWVLNNLLRGFYPFVWRLEW